MNVNPLDERLIKGLPAEIGSFLINTNLDASLKFFNDAMLILPEDRYCILKRAVVRKRALHFCEALDDVNAALRLDPQDLRANAIKNDILYLEKYFEKGFIMNYRFLKRRSHPDEFLMGQRKCLDAILNCVDNERCGHPLRDYFKIIRQQAWQKATESTVRQFKSKNARKRKMSSLNTVELAQPEEKLIMKRNLERRISVDSNDSDGISSNTTADENSKDSSSKLETWKKVRSKRKANKLVDFPFRPLQDRTSNLDNFLSEKYLEKLHREKLFLKQLPIHNGFVAPNRKHEDKMRLLVNKCQKHLCSLQELLRSCRPFYYIKYQERKNAIRAEEHKKHFLCKQRKMTNQAFHNIYRRLQVAFNTKNLKTLMSLIESLVDLYKNLPKIYFHEQRKNIIESFKLLRDGYYFFGSFSPGMTEVDKINRIKVLLGIQMQRAPSKDSLYNNLKQYHPTDWSAKIKITEERLKKCNIQDEIIYFNYELARFHLKLGKTEFVHSYARRCIKNARETNEMRWVINAEILVIKAFIYNSNKIDALRHLKKTLVISKTMSSEDLIEFLTMALEVVRKTDFSPAVNARCVIRKRQKEILNLLKDDNINKMNAEELFRKLSSTPARRTMSMIPGIKIIDEIQREKTTRKRVKSTKPMTDNIHQNKRGLGFYDYVRDFIDV